MKTVFASPKGFLPYYSIVSIKTILLITTLFGSPKGGLNGGILLPTYECFFVFFLFFFFNNQWTFFSSIYKIFNIIHKFAYFPCVYATVPLFTLTKTIGNTHTKKIIIIK